jgi:hypothetical protein
LEHSRRQPNRSVWSNFNIAVFALNGNYASYQLGRTDRRIVIPLAIATCNKEKFLVAARIGRYFSIRDSMHKKPPHPQKHCDFTR